MKSIAVIGGGVAGVTTAYALAKRGFHVTLYEGAPIRGDGDILRQRRAALGVKR